KKEGIGAVEVLDRVTMQVFVREHFTVIAAPVQCDVDGIPKGSHYVRVPIAIRRPNVPMSGAEAQRGGVRSMGLLGGDTTKRSGKRGLITIRELTVNV